MRTTLALIATLLALPGAWAQQPQREGRLGAAAAAEESPSHEPSPAQLRWRSPTS